MSKEEAIRKADIAQKAYDKANEKRDAKRTKEHKKKWKESLQADNDMFALDNLSDSELSDYFSQDKKNNDK